MAEQQSIGTSQGCHCAPEVDVMELVMEQRMEMESKQELDRVERLNKVSRIVLNPVLGTKLARNVLTKKVTGPLGNRRTPPPTLMKRRPSDQEYEQRLAHFHSMKQSQNEELDTLRRRGIVRKQIANRRMRSRAKKMFNNHRIFTNSERSKNKSSILVTEKREEEVKSFDYIRQESQMYIDNFFRNPSKNRRVLQRLNSNQIGAIKDSEMKRVKLRTFQHLPFDAYEEDAPLINGKMERGVGTTEQVGTQAQNSENMDHPSDLISQNGQLTRADSLANGHIPTEAKSEKTGAPTGRKLSKGEKTPSKLSKLGRKLKGGISKLGKRKGHKIRHASSSLDELVDDVRVKPRKKSAERRRLNTSKKVKTTALEDENVQYSPRPSQVPISTSLPAQKPNKLTSPPGMSDNWPPLPSKGSHEPRVKSLDQTALKPALSHDWSCDCEAACGPPYPMCAHAGSTSPEGEPMFNGFKSHDDHMTAPSPPTTTLREIEQNDEAGYMSESESGTYSDGYIAESLSDTRTYKDSVLERSESVRVATDGGNTLPGSEEDDEEADQVPDLPTPSLRKKSKSHEEHVVNGGSPHSTYKRHYSAPMIVPQTPSKSGPSLMLYDHPTPHGFYTPATVEVNPFSVEFEEGARSLTQAKVGDTTVSSTVTCTELTCEISHDFADFEPSDPPFMLEAVETHTHVTCTQTRHTRHQVLEPGPVTCTETGPAIPPRAFKDPMFLRYIKTLDHEPTASDYITYKLRSIGDQIDQQYDDKLNQALDAIFMEAVKNTVSWETFSAISKRLLVEGRKVQDGIFLITCFGRRLAEMVPTIGDTVTDFTGMVVDAYASDFLLNIGGWGRLVESYNQVEATPQDYEYKTFDSDLDAVGAGSYFMYEEDAPRHHKTRSSYYPNGTNSADTPVPNHPQIIQVNPPSPEPLYEPLVTFEPPTCVNRLRRVISVEVLFNEADSTEHAQNSYHGNTNRQPSLTRSLSTSSIDVVSATFHKQFFYSNLLTPSPTKPVPDQFHMESQYNYGRRGSTASICSTASIRIIDPSSTGPWHEETNVMCIREPKFYTEVPPGNYLDLHFDTPNPSRSNTISNHDNKPKEPTNKQVRTRISIAVPIVTVAVAITVVGAIGFIYFRYRK